MTREERMLANSLEGIGRVVRPLVAKLASDLAAVEGCTDVDELSRALFTLATRAQRITDETGGMSAAIRTSLDLPTLETDDQIKAGWRLRRRLATIEEIRGYTHAPDDMTALIALIALYGDDGYREHPGYARVSKEERQELDSLRLNDARERVASWISDIEAQADR